MGAATLCTLLSPVPQPGASAAALEKGRCSSCPCNLSFCCIHPGPTVIHMIHSTIVGGGYKTIVYRNKHSGEIRQLWAPTKAKLWIISLMEEGYFASCRFGTQRSPPGVGTCASDNKLLTAAAWECWISTSHTFHRRCSDRTQSHAARLHWIMDITVCHPALRHRLGYSSTILPLLKILSLCRTLKTYSSKPELA